MSVDEEQYSVKRDGNQWIVFCHLAKGPVMNTWGKVLRFDTEDGADELRREMEAAWRES